MSRPERIVLVSDLHLGAGDEHDPFRRDLAFVALIRHLAHGRVAPGTRRLAVLGDFLELLGVRAADEPRVASSAPVALHRLDRIVRAHPAVFTALADLLASGWDLDVVVGNHDVELLRPQLRHRLAHLLERGASGAGRVRVHPWILHVPGILYAEHGHQYHDINWYAQLGWAAGRSGGEAIRHPLAAHLGGPRPALAAALVRHAALGLLGTRDPRRLRYRRDGLAAVAGELHLGVDVLRSIDLVPAASVASTARRGAASLARPGPGAAGYLHRAAAAIDRILRREGSGCAVYAFGHSHAAECVPLPAAGAKEPPVYLNAGAWCRDVRGSLRHATEDEQATFAVIECRTGASPSVALRSWHEEEDMAAPDRR